MLKPKSLHALSDNKSHASEPTLVRPSDILLKGATIHTTRHEVSGIFVGVEEKKTDGNSPTTTKKQN